ncbi:MAG: hemerythrin domain-containing protein [Desulfobacterales bacterium]
MNAIDDLLAEHEAVRLTLKILKKIAQDIEATGKVSNPAHMEQLLDFFSTFVDRCHHGKEEELLFPALEQVGVSREGGPVGVMLKEHQQGRDLVAKMKAALGRHRKGDTDAARELGHHADNYITLLELHIDKENKVLFPLAVKHLPENALDEMKIGFDKIETDKIGAGRHEAYHEMLDRFKAIYLD